MCFLLVPPAVIVNIEDTSNFHEFLSILKFIYTPFKRVSKVTDLYVDKSQNRCACHKKIFSYVSLHLLKFSFKAMLKPRPS